MERVTFYPMADGGRVRHVCAKPGPKPRPAELVRQPVTLRLYASDVAEMAEMAAQAGMTLREWMEAALLGGLRTQNQPK